MRKFLVTCTSSNMPELVKTGQQFETVEDTSIFTSNTCVLTTGVVSGCYLQVYILNNGHVTMPAINATFTARELK